VLKPVDNERFSSWHAKIMDRISEKDFRVARPVAAADGRWICDGWSASQWVPGTHEHSWRDVISAGEAFHRAIRDTEAPSFLSDRGDPWSVGDRVAWEEAPMPPLGKEHQELVRHLFELRRPLELEPQLIHGDLTENVLFEDGLPPAVIDMAPYRRPVGFASGIVVGDALLWFDGDAQLTASVSASVPMFGQLLIRALIYRLVTGGLFGAVNVPEGAEAAVRIASSIA
jgi:uncharacterized protein (TIGR02569 family)